MQHTPDNGTQFNGRRRRVCERDPAAQRCHAMQGRMSIRCPRRRNARRRLPMLAAAQRVGGRHSASGRCAAARRTLADSLFLQTHQQTNTRARKHTRRYKMLLAEILKATHAAHPHHARLSLALSMVTETAHIVNEAVTTHTRARVRVRRSAPDRAADQKRHHATAIMIDICSAFLLIICSGLEPRPFAVAGAAARAAGSDHRAAGYVCGRRHRRSAVGFKIGPIGCESS
jgi:hypothetical protein